MPGKPSPALHTTAAGTKPTLDQHQPFNKLNCSSIQNLPTELFSGLLGVGAVTELAPGLPPGLNMGSLLLLSTAVAT